MVADALGDGPFLLGSTFCAADIYLLMMAQWHPDKASLLERLPVLGALCDAVKQRPAIAAIWEASFPE